jgi:hypothetical protein
MEDDNFCACVTLLGDRYTRCPNAPVVYMAGVLKNSSYCRYVYHVCESCANQHKNDESFRFMHEDKFIVLIVMDIMD